MGTSYYLIEFQSRRRTRSTTRCACTTCGRGGSTPRPVVDPREADEEMRGFPVTPAQSRRPLGLHAVPGAGEHPFIHALDTVEKSARCIDVHGLMGFERLGDLKLDVSPDGGTIAVALGP